MAKTDLLLLDDWGLAAFTDEARRDLLEIFDDRHNTRSTQVTRQLPVKHWHENLGDPTVADAILDRLVHNAHRIALTGESMRKTKSAAVAQNTGSTQAAARLCITLRQRSTPRSNLSPSTTPKDPAQFTHYSLRDSRVQMSVESRSSFRWNQCPSSVEFAVQACFGLFFSCLPTVTRF